MDKENILSLLDRPIAYHRCFVPIAAGVGGAVFLSQLVYWSSRSTQKDGSIYKTQEEWSQETGLGRYEQEAARRALKLSGVLLEIKKGIPCRLYFKLDTNKLASLLDSANLIAGNQQTSMRISASKVASFPHTNTETTILETTTETTNKNLRASRGDLKTESKAKAITPPRTSSFTPKPSAKAKPNQDPYQNFIDQLNKLQEFQLFLGENEQTPFRLKSHTHPSLYDEFLSAGWAGVQEAIELVVENGYRSFARVNGGEVGAVHLPALAVGIDSAHRQAGSEATL